MEKPDWVNDDQLRVWSNAWSIGIKAIILCMIPGIFFISFIEKGYYASLIFGIICLYLFYELTVHSFIRIMYLNGELDFRKPLSKYSLFFRKKEHHLRIKPNEWTEVYSYSFRDGYSHYFRNERTAAYFVTTDGLSNFSQDLNKLFRKRVKETDDFPRDLKRKLRKEMPERVF